MSRFTNDELRKFRDVSRCYVCVHYSGCQLWLAMLLLNEELNAPGLDIIIPDITKGCPMFVSSAESSAAVKPGLGGQKSACWLSFCLFPRNVRVSPPQTHRNQGVKSPLSEGVHPRQNATPVIRRIDAAFGCLLIGESRT
jgi:hypothetical protein